MTSALPRQRGTYVLLLRLRRRSRVEVGRLGEVEFAAGWYAYVGSAHGPGGLAARIAHHLGPAPRPRWHLDWLRRVAAPVEVWYASGPRGLEHTWADSLAEGGELHPVVPGFGASDCRCRTHLFHSARRPSRPPLSLPSSSPVLVTTPWCTTRAGTP